MYPFPTRPYNARFPVNLWRRAMLADYSLLLISAILVNNFVLVQLLGLCPFMGVSGRLEPAIGMASATTFVLTLTALGNWIVLEWLLKPLGLEYLRLLAFILVIAAAVRFTDLMVRRSNPLLHRTLGIYLPLITTNCAILGVALLNVRGELGLVAATLHGFGAGAGFSLVLVLFAAMRERLVTADEPPPFRGAAIGMITAGLISLAFMGFAGLA
jgi:electron transport complex protein RnfA